MRLGLRPATLDKWRVTGGGPEFLRLSARAIRYDAAALDAWASARKRSSTSDIGGQS